MADIQPLPGGSLVRRHFLTTGPEEPILTDDPAEHMERFETLLEASGLPVERVLLTPVVSVPLPVARLGEDGGVERWQVAPELLWHPFFWMPKRLSMRYRYRTIDEASGGTSDDFEIEGDEVWAIRVMLELTACGLYDQSTGTWLDVLAWHGIDVNDPVDLARVQVWQDGEQDDVLDNIDLSPMLAIDDNPEWALYAAREFSEVIIPAQWSLTARTIGAQLQGQLDYGAGTDEDRRKLLSVFGSIASNALRTMPATDEEEITVTEFLTAIVDQAGDPEADSEYLMRALRDTLREVQIDFEPYLRGLNKNVPNDVDPHESELTGKRS